ncbi:M48 family metalloprotease [Streptomyces sp. NPDC046984]|uniref:M48 family metalloprotease n=1 Tax=Streptomyces sp. NPDC046984 TaxID=3155138 RepID=UPI00340E5AD4
MSAATAGEAPADHSTVVDERVLGSGTTLRFVLLLVLFAVGALSMSLDLVNAFTYDRHANAYLCYLAAGDNPAAGIQQQVLFSAPLDSDAMKDCLARYTTNLSWVPFVVTPALIAAGYGLYRVLPVWKQRRSRLVPLDGVDVFGTLRPLLDDLVATAGIAGRPPRILVNPTAATTGAVVFGTSRRATISLDGGLLVKSRTDPARFRAVVLHELAHIYNSDVGITYATVAMWRTFLVLVLLPQIVTFAHGAAVSTVPTSWGRAYAYAHVIAQPFLISLLVYLTRADILRTREIHADLTAARRGASRHSGFPAAARNTAGPSYRVRAWAAFRQLWRTHPSWAIRHRSLTDPAPVFQSSALPMFLTGAATGMASVRLHNLPGSSLLMIRVQALLLAGLAMTITGALLWRAVAYAVLTGRRVPTGWNAGLWFGAGLIVPEMTDPLVNDRWLPTHPEALLILAAVCVLALVWTAQYAELRIRTARGHTLRWAMLWGIAPPWLLLSYTLNWWNTDGLTLATGWFYSTSVTLKAIGLTGVPTLHPSLPSQIDAVLFNLPGHNAAADTLWWGLPLLWIVPLALWGAVRPPLRAPAWLTRARPQVPDPAPLPGVPPRLVHVLRPGLIGGAVCCTALLLVMAVTAHSDTWFSAGPDRVPAAAMLDYLTEIKLVLCGTGVLTAAVVAVRGDSRYPLLRGLIAAGVATLTGTVGEWVLRTADGCFGPLNVERTFCRWENPADTWPGIPIALGQPLGPALVLAGLTAAALGAFPSLRRSRAEVKTEAIAKTSRRAQLARRLTASAIVTAALLQVATVTAQATIAVATSHDTSTTVSASDLWAEDTTPRVSVETARLQLLAWARVGGVDLFSQTVAARNDLRKGFEAALDAPPADFLSVYAAQVPQTCGGFSALVRKARAFFPVPVAEGQHLWTQFLERFESTYEACEASTQNPTFAKADTVNISLSRAIDAYNAFHRWASRFEAPTAPPRQ